MKTQTFVGQFANKLLKEIKVSKAFIGVNGIDGHTAMTANEEEGNGNKIILNNAIEKYMLRIIVSLIVILFTLFIVWMI